MTTYIDMIYEGITLNGKTYNLVVEEEIRQFNSYSFALVEAVAEDAERIHLGSFDTDQYDMAAAEFYAKDGKYSDTAPVGEGDGDKLLTQEEFARGSAFTDAQLEVEHFEIPKGVPEEAIKALREYIERELYSAGRGFVEAYAQNRKEEEEQGA